jgi:hypothetical protein
MAKGKNEPPDYLDQLHWQARHKHSRWRSIYFEPKWKYKIVYRYPQTSLSGRIIQILTVAGGIYLAIRFAFAVLVNSQLELPGKIFFCFITGLIVAIIFFAIRDGSKDDVSKHIDS